MKTWIKLYTEILSDPKMGRLSDKLFRRAIELFLLAGKEDKDGVLPPISDIAWNLHLSEKEVRNGLKELEKVGIIVLKSDADGSEKYLVAHFSVRQNSAYDRSEINRRYYEKSKSKKYESKTSESLNVRPDSDIQISESNTVEVEVEEEVDKEEEVEVEKIKPSASPKPQKHKHGQFQNVLLTDDELSKLRERFADADKRIESFSLAKQAKGYVYKSDYAAILKWAEKDAVTKPIVTKQPEPYKST